MTTQSIGVLGESVNPGDWEQQLLDFLLTTEQGEEKLAVVPVSEMSAASFTAHLALRHSGPFRDRVPGAHLWAHSVDHHLYAAELDHTHRDLPDAEELARRVEEGEARLRRYALTAARKEKERQNAHRQAYARGMANGNAR